MKTHLTYIIAIVALIATILFFYDKWRKASEEVDRKNSIIAEKNAQIQYNTSETGRIIAEKQAAEATAKEALEAYPEIINKLKSEMDIRDRNMKAFIDAQVNAHAVGASTVINNNYYDSGAQKELHAFEFEDTDGYFSIKASIFPDRPSNQFLSDNYPDYHGIAIEGSNLPSEGGLALWQGEYSDSILYAFHTRKKWLMGKETLYATGRLSNPNARVVNQTAVMVSEAKDKRWVAAALVGYDPFAGEVRATVGVGYAFLKF